MFDKQAFTREVQNNILPFWMRLRDDEHGGYYGGADFHGVVNKQAGKGSIMHARILWTFSRAYGLYKNPVYAEHAAHARDFLMRACWDDEHGGLYWLVSHDGTPLDDCKQLYNIAFGIYAFSEHYRAVGDASSLARALALFHLTEAYGRDTRSGGYIEARTRDWQDIVDSRICARELNCVKSMNTNLHILEAYTCLLRASGDDGVREALRSLIAVTTERIIRDRTRFDLFFDMDWRVLTDEISYGHDIEGSWLLYDAAQAVGDADGLNKTAATALSIAEAVYAHGRDGTDGGLLSGRDRTGRLLTKKEWWPQAEAVVGFYNAYQLSGDVRYRDEAVALWDYIDRFVADRVKGDWHNELFPGNTPDERMPKAGFWKCPYHSARMCFEMTERLA